MADSTTFPSFLLMGLIAAASGTMSYLGTSLITGQSNDMAASANVARLDAKLEGVAGQLAALQSQLLKHNEEVSTVAVLAVRVTALERLAERHEAELKVLETRK